MSAFDVVVIGGGTAGLVTASGCARLGKKVALIERERLGGDCLWTGCVPTKALVASARLAAAARNASQLGFADTELSPVRVLESMREVRKTISRHDADEKFEKLGIEVIHGRAHFVAPRVVAVDGRELQAKDVVIATGSRTSIPPIDGLSDAGFIDHASLLDLDALPRSVTVLGGGPIGIEFAQILVRLGSKVTVVEAGATILAREDREIAARAREILAAEGVAFKTGTKVERVRLEDGLRIATPDTGEEIASEQIFVASGRRGNIEDLTLPAANIAIEGTYVRVDAYLETSAPRVWACGDVHGGLQFTHVAAHEAVALVRNMLFPGKAAVSYENVPWAVYTDPEIAHLGMTEEEARRSGADVRTYSVEMEDVDRAVVDRRPGGLLKLVCDRKGRLLGAHALCADASTLIQALVVARAKNVRLPELARIVSAYPSMSDAIGKAGATYYEGLSRGFLGRIGRVIARFS